MNFERLELKGFKSFADKVTIDFKEGVTAIIGPNGCGKSNIADAIRWTLGEQSAKQLRGKNMQDVIFNGTENRKSTSYCEVSLYFDNENGKVFPNFEADNVVITRKLDRSGNSEYFINRSRCRMKDIINLIHDTGIGKEGYSIIGQGRIDELLSAKPEDRRHIFEEAAGISKFRYQRNEAERKLDKANQNLTVANERIAEIERQILPLRKQAETAKRYFELKDLLKIQEVNLYIYQYENNESVKQKIKDRLMKTSEEIANLEKQFNECVSEFDRCMSDFTSLDDVSKNLNAELLALKVEQASILGEGKVFQEKLNNLNGDESRLAKDKLNFESLIEKLDEAIKTASEEKDEKLKNYAISAREYEAVNAQYNSLVDALKSEESEFEEKNKDYIRSVEQLSTLRSNLSGLISEKGINQERAKNLRDALKQKRAALDEDLTVLSIVEGNLNELKEKNAELIVAQNEAVEEKRSAKEALNSIADDLLAINNKISTQNANIEMMRQIKDSFAGYQEAVKALMQEAKENPQVKAKVMGVVAEEIKVPEEYVSAVENVLGASLQNIIVKNEDDAKFLIGVLKQKRFGRATFRPLTTCREKSIGEKNAKVLTERGCLGLLSDHIEYDAKFEKLISALMGDTVVVEDIDVAVRLFRNYNQEFKIVTLDGDLFAKNGSISGGFKKSDKMSLLDQERKIAQMEENAKKLSDNLDELAKLKAQNEKAVEECENKIKDIERQMFDLKGQAGLYNERIRLSRENVERLKVDIASCEAELIEADKIVSELTEKISSVDELESDVKQKKEWFGQLSEQQDNSKAKKSERDELARKLTDLRVQNATMKGLIDKISDEIFRLSNERSSYKENLIEVDVQLKIVQGKIAELQNAPQRSSFTGEELSHIADLEKQIDSLSSRKENLKNRISELDTAKNRMTEEKSVLSEKKIRDEGSLERVDIEIRSMQEHILEEYDLTYTNALPLKDEEFDHKKAGGEIASLKRSISRLGDVNLLAVKDLEELEERYSTLSAERDDIKTAYDDLKKIIADLTSEMVVKFNDAFEKINANFQDVFKKLFDGGTGKLVLQNIDADLTNSDEVDPLEAGIEIYAQPPGKKLQHISLLSGGEKALTAISILFAILQLKPMPFCILDEIEAALDDANANLFAELLKIFSDKTQFIVITHRKPTMRHADSIFGVAMEEKGVTKIVSIEFEEAVKHASDNGVA